MHQNMFGGWAPPGPAGLTEIAGLALTDEFARLDIVGGVA